MQPGVQNVERLAEQERFFNDREEFTFSEIKERTIKLEGSELKSNKRGDLLRLKFPVYKDHVKVIFFDQVRFDELENKIFVKKTETMFPVR